MITTLQDVETWFSELCQSFGLGWHPDTPFEDFTGITPERAAILNTLMAQAFEVCAANDADIYDLGLSAFRQHDPEFYATVIDNSL